MARYLTPTKIGLLALTCLYTDSVIPSTAIIPILSFLVSYLLPTDPNPSFSVSTIPNRSFHNSIDSLQQVTIGHASGIPGRTIWDLLLNKIWEIDSFDALHAFFDRLSSLLSRSREDQRAVEDARKPGQICLSLVSPLGAFVRRAQLEFTRLQFHDGVNLWKEFVTYRSPTLVQWRRRHPGAGHEIDINLQQAGSQPTECIRNITYGDPAGESRKGASVSTEDIEKLLEYQVDQMQSTSSSKCASDPYNRSRPDRDGQQAAAGNEHPSSGND